MSDFDFDALHRTLVELSGELPQKADKDRYSGGTQLVIIVGRSHDGKTANVNYSISSGYHSSDTKVDGAAHPGELVEEYERRIKWSVRQRMKALPTLKAHA